MSHAASHITDVLFCYQQPQLLDADGLIQRPLFSGWQIWNRRLFFSHHETNFQMILNVLDFNSDHIRISSLLEMIEKAVDGYPCSKAWQNTADVGYTGKLNRHAVRTTRLEHLNNLFDLIGYIDVLARFG